MKGEITPQLKKKGEGCGEGTPSLDFLLFEVNNNFLNMEYAVKIYTLSDQQGNVFYVGCTVQNIETRLCGHISEARDSYNVGSRESRKIKVIRDSEFKISATIVDMITIEADKAQDAVFMSKELEERWIEKYLNEGVDLCNKVRAKKDPPPQFVGKTVKAA